MACRSTGRFRDVVTDALQKRLRFQGAWLGIHDYRNATKANTTLPSGAGIVIGWRRSPVDRLLIDILARRYAKFDRVDQILEVIDDLKRESFQPLAKKTLIRLLPLLDENNASLLSKADFALLYKELFECDAALTLAILDMLAAVRSAAAIEPVEGLSKGGGCLGRRNQAVKEAAVRTIDLLKSAN